MLKLDQQPLEYSIRAMVACDTCGASYSATVEARYSIVKKVSPPAFHRSTGNEFPPFICAGLFFFFLQTSRVFYQDILC